ncbi:type II toxin-antitoxin system VapC family toxin [Dyadobacter sediminis]|uniref:Type II toxin-antitoxin system VapC family toxin n=1 Tax=Dyadobacter sediminis TaxID=1493691 RepID=A0A5R9K8B8_9BACT|nr:type II toxin-antitoxin system VapC family toxin [Dyadobacter sediminis]TLU90059.1 type II toxin-antitoxin system VapC family toxin [Dyadobacter sediminis]
MDTQILIWALISPFKLSAEILKLLSSNQICVSQISILEIAIKQKTGKLTALPIAIDLLEKVILNDGFEIISLATKHIVQYESIPLFPQHRDPFDRLLLATAYSERMSIISADSNFGLYTNFIQLIKA